MALMYDYVTRANSTTKPRLQSKFPAFTLCAWILFSNLLPWEFFYVKVRNFTISKRGLVVKFAHLT